VAAGLIEAHEALGKRAWIGVKKLLCVDDSSEMLALLVDFLEPEFEVVGALTSGSSVVAAAASLKPDIILLDLDLGDGNGFVVARQLRAAGCPAKIVFLSVHESLDFIEAAEAMGAAGYVAKSQIARDLLKTLRR
jgi:two-component system, NarL family, nitrate/nitrite response regulator NarP